MTSRCRLDPAILQGLRLKELRKLCRVLIAAGRDTATIRSVILAARHPNWNGRQLGRHIKFGKADYLLYAQAEGRFPSTIQPYDASKLEMSAMRRRFHAPRKAAALRDRRAARRKREADLAAGTADAAALD
jgi:hypothetical protein